MDIESIESYLKVSHRNLSPIEIRFKGRSPVAGLFIKSADYAELKSKNFWRVVHVSQLQKWSDSKDLSLARIFYGGSFTALADFKM